MSVKTIYVCDRCKKEYTQEENDKENIVPMRVVGILVQPLMKDHERFHKPGLHHKQLWCTACIDQFNLDGLILKAETEVKKFTLEDHIKEIVTHAMKEAE